MKRTILFMLFVAATCCSAADLEKLIPALITVESHGDNYAIGDGGRAVGCLQIRQKVLDDVNKRFGKHYTRASCYDRQMSIQICKYYLTMYGEMKSTQQAARIWNGGPRGDRKQSTLKYWEKVKHELEERK